MLEDVDSISFLTPQGKDGSAKKGGRPRKKDLDEKMDGVAKLVSAQIILNLDIFMFSLLRAAICTFTLALVVPPMRVLSTVMTTKKWSR